MNFKGGIFSDTMIINMSGHCSIIFCLNVIEMMTKSFDNGIFGLPYIDAWNCTNIAGNCINQIATLAIRFGDSSICPTFIEFVIVPVWLILGQYLQVFFLLQDFLKFSRILHILRVNLHNCPDCPLVAILGVGGFGQASVGVGKPEILENKLRIHSRSPTEVYY